MTKIKELLALPEGKTIEFKKDLSSLKPIIKTLVAFANTAGGTLIIGQSNNGEVVGINDIFEAEEKLANVIAESIRPALLPEIEISSVGGKALIVITVPYWRGPFYLKALGPERGSYIRLGSTNRQAEGELFNQLKRKAAQQFFDELPCPETGPNELDYELIERVFSKVNRQVDENKLLSLGVLVPYAKKKVCSYGGIILFGKQEIREKYFPGCFVRCARFRSTEKVNFIDQYDVEKSIVEATEDVLKFVRRNSRMAAVIEDVKRKDIEEYSQIIVREILTNAFVHADYSIKGMSLRVAIFSNRMEIESPGMLPFGYTFDDFFSGVSHMRNKVITRVFRELKLMEEWGTGYKRIKETCKNNNYLLPEWSEHGLSVQATLNPHELTTDNPKPAPNIELTERQEHILKVLKKQGTSTSKKLYKKLNLDISERTLRTELSNLKEKDFVRPKGAGPSTVWKCVN